MLCASQDGHLQIVQYAESKGANVWNACAMGAARKRHFEIVKYIGEKEQLYIIVWREYMISALKNGSLSDVKYAVSKGINNYNEYIVYAASGGYIKEFYEECLKYNN